MIKISMIENGVHLTTYVYDKWYLTWFYFVFISHLHFIGTLVSLVNKYTNFW